MKAIVDLFEEYAEQSLASAGTGREEVFDRGLPGKVAVCARKLGRNTY